MARATEILDLYIPSYYAPWWVRLETKKHGIYVMVDDPDYPEGSGKTISRVLSADEIHNAFQAIADSHLCCEDAMKEDGYGMGCANDGDLILQYAVFGKIVYG